MKKFIVLVALFIVSAFPVAVLAQDTTLPAPVTEENTQPELPIGEDENKNNDDKTPTISEDTQQSFVNGALVGVVAGLVVGGVITWFLKDKII